MQLVKQPWPDLDLPAALDPSLWPALRSLLGPDAPAALRRPALPAKLLTSPQPSGLAGGVRTRRGHSASGFRSRRGLGLFSRCVCSTSTVFSSNSITDKRKQSF